MNAIHFLYRRAMTKIFLECRLSPSVFGLAAIWNSSLHNYYSPKAKFQPNNLEHAFRLFHRCLTVITWSVFKTSITVLNVSRKSALPWTLKIPEKKWNLPCIYHISLSQLRSGQWRCRVQQNYADGIEGLIAPLVPRSVHERNPLQLQSFWTIITFYPASSSWISNSSQVSKSQPSGQCRIWSEESRPFPAPVRGLSPSGGFLVPERLIFSPLPSARDLTTRRRTLIQSSPLSTCTPTRMASSCTPKRTVSECTPKSRFGSGQSRRRPMQWSSTSTLHIRPRPPSLCTFVAGLHIGPLAKATIVTWTRIRPRRYDIRPDPPGYSPKVSATHKRTLASHPWPQRLIVVIDIFYFHISQYNHP